jgi:hypothetical protein
MTCNFGAGLRGAPVLAFVTWPTSQSEPRKSVKPRRQWLQCIQDALRMVDRLERMLAGHEPYLPPGSYAQLMQTIAIGQLSCRNSRLAFSLLRLSDAAGEIEPAERMQMEIPFR